MKKVYAFFTYIIIDITAAINNTTTIRQASNLVTLVSILNAAAASY